MNLLGKLIFSAAMLASAAASAYSATEDGYDLWLRYRPLPAAQAAQLEPLARIIVAPSLRVSQPAQAVHDAANARPWNALRDLREQRLASVHGSPRKQTLAGIGFHELSTGFNRTLLV